MEILLRRFDIPISDEEIAETPFYRARFLRDLVERLEGMGEGEVRL